MKGDGRARGKFAKKRKEMENRGGGGDGYGEIKRKHLRGPSLQFTIQ